MTRRIAEVPFGDTDLHQWGRRLIDDLEQAFFDIDNIYGQGWQISNLTKDRIADLRTATITGITAANPGVVSSIAHGFANDDVITVIGVLGMVEVNGSVFSVKNKADDIFELGTTDTSGFTAYGSGGIAIATTFQELASLVGTLIQDLKDRGRLAQ